MAAAAMSAGGGINQPGAKIESINGMAAKMKYRRQTIGGGASWRGGARRHHQWRKKKRRIE
jgi:hypothetical protein